MPAAADSGGAVGRRAADDGASALHQRQVASLHHTYTTHKKEPRDHCTSHTKATLHTKELLNASTFGGWHPTSSSIDSLHTSISKCSGNKCSVSGIRCGESESKSHSAPCVTNEARSLPVSSQPGRPVLRFGHVDKYLCYLPPVR